MANKDFDRLRDILLGPDKKNLEQLDKCFEDPKEHAKAISQILPEAVKLSNAEGERLSAELMPTVEQAVKDSVRRDIHIFADALFPVIGPAIRKSITETFRQMVQSINQALEHSFSWQGIKWRFQAWRTGKPFAEIVLMHSLVYRIEQVFLIHKNSGILIQHVALAEVEHQDADLVSAMLTAIQDFVKDSFQVKSEQGLNQIQMGDLSLWIEQGPEAVLAGVIRGNAPENIRQVLSNSLEDIHRQYGSLLENFDGEVSAFNNCEDILQKCLISQYHTEKKNISWMTWLFLGTALFGLLLWSWLSIQEQMRWQLYVDKIKAEPGYVVTDAFHRDGKYRMQGMKDPLATDYRELMNQSVFQTNEVIHDFQPYQSLKTEFVIKRTRKILKPPETIELDIRNGILFVSGQAPLEWTEQLNNRSSFIAGIEEVNRENLQAIIDLSSLNAPDSVQLELKDRKLIVKGQANQIWAKTAKLKAAKLNGISHYDDSQLVVNTDLSFLQAPDGVQLDFNNGILAISGHAPNSWIIGLEERIAGNEEIEKLITGELTNSDENLLKLLAKELQAEGIFFDTGTSMIDNDDESILQVLEKLRLLMEQAEILALPIKVVIQGHSDSSGNFERRRYISIQRARYVQQYLVNQGIRPEVLEVKSMVKPGQNLIERSEQEMRFNRRVSFVIRFPDSREATQ